MYEIHDGRIRTWSLEAHVADHCNLSCAQCCTLSPGLKPRFTSPEELARELEALAPVLRPQVFKITGGEPLLHPAIEEILGAARGSGISDQIQVTTNGHLLGSAGGGFWNLLDRLTISVYPDPPLDPGLIELARRECGSRGIILNLKRVDRFAVMTHEAGFNRPEEAARVFEACWLKVRCHLAHEGRFFCCTRPPHLEQRLSGLGIEARLSRADGIELKGEGLGRRLFDYLESGAPLESCTFCRGVSGGYVAHCQG